jgi:hypothetical protein
VGLAAHGAHLGGDLLAGVQLAAGDKNVGAVGREGFYHLVAQAATAAGHQGDLACKIEVVGHAPTQDV